jgi:hypothetical protein
MLPIITGRDGDRIKIEVTVELSGSMKDLRFAPPRTKSISRLAPSANAFRCSDEASPLPGVFLQDQLRGIADLTLPPESFGPSIMERKILRRKNPLRSLELR